MCQPILTISIRKTELISVLFVVQKNDQKLKTTFGHLIREA